MEKMLLKMARQLNAMDEASLMALWGTYLQRVQNFDGSREWEESAIVLSLIQAVRSKNNLFNTKLEERELANRTQELFPQEDRPPRRRMAEDRPHSAPQKKAKVHSFRPLS